MGTKLASVALAGILIGGVVSPAAASAAEPASAQGPAGQSPEDFVSSVITVGQAYLGDPLGIFLGSLGVGSVAPFILSSWAGFDILPD